MTRRKALKGTSANSSWPPVIFQHVVPFGGIKGPQSRGRCESGNRRHRFPRRGLIAPSFARLALRGRRMVPLTPTTLLRDRCDSSIRLSIRPEPEKLIVLSNLLPGKYRMDIHKNARLTLRRREDLVQHVAGGVTLKLAAANFRVTPKTAAKWIHRFRLGCSIVLPVPGAVRAELRPRWRKKSSPCGANFIPPIGSPKPPNSVLPPSAVFCSALI